MVLILGKRVLKRFARFRTAELAGVAVEVGAVDVEVVAVEVERGAALAVTYRILSSIKARRNQTFGARSKWFPRSISSLTHSHRESDESPVEKEKRNFKTSGALTKDARTDAKTGIELKYLEPADADMPKDRWRLYPFKQDQTLGTKCNPISVSHSSDPYPLHRKSCYLIGRDRQVVDIATDHPSCSKQHAVIQFRTVLVNDEETSTMRRVNKYETLLELCIVNLVADRT